MSATPTSNSTNLSPISASCFLAYPSSCNAAAVITKSSGWANATTPTNGGIRTDNDADLWTSSTAQSTVSFAFQGTEGYFSGFTGAGYGKYQCSYDGGSTFDNGEDVDQSSFSVANFCDKTGLSSSETTTIVLRVINAPIDLLAAGWLTGRVATVTIGATVVQSETLVASGKTVTLIQTAPSTSTTSSSGDIAGMSASTFWVMMAVVGAGVVILIAFCVMTVTKKQEDTVVTYKKARVEEKDNDDSDDALGVSKRYRQRSRRRRSPVQSPLDPENDYRKPISPASSDDEFAV